MTLRTGGITMGIMTLALSLFSIIPMALLLANRVFWARVITQLVKTPVIHIPYEIKPKPNENSLDRVPTSSCQTGKSLSLFPLNMLSPRDCRATDFKIFIL